MVKPGNKLPMNAPFDTVKYIDVLVEITLQFIRAEYESNSVGFQVDDDKHDEETQEKVAETMTVNASACEFMELILK